METHDLTAKLMAKTPKIVRNCEGWANGGESGAGIGGGAA
jgi:hypothetical protein